MIHWLDILLLKLGEFFLHEESLVYLFLCDVCLIVILFCKFISGIIVHIFFPCW